MVFRRDNKPEFQRQMGALREQLGAQGEAPGQAAEPTFAETRPEASYAPPPVRDAPPPSRDTGNYSYGSYAPAPVVPQAPEPTSTPMADAQTSVVAQETIWKGDLESRGSIHVHGRVEGNVTAAKEIYIAEQAEVDASLMAAVVIVAGKVTGEVRCTSRFEMLPSGRVDGNVQAPSLVIHEGASITGQFRMGSPEVNQEGKVASVMGRRAARGTA
jgi:cytoskeletal protein CcmA (bactofilin family)